MPDARGGRPRMVLGLIVVLAAVDLGVYAILAGRASQSSDEAAIDGDRIVVSAPAPGRIASLAKEEGEAAAKGEALASLDDGDLRALEREALAGGELARRNVALVEAGLDQAEDDLRKATERFRSGVIPRRQLEGASSAEVSAKAQLEAARALASLAEAQASAAKANLERMVVKSPIDGLVARKWAAAGASVQPGQPIYTLYDPRGLRVEAYFGKSQLSRIAVGDSAEISLDAFPGKKLSGKVEEVGTDAPSRADRPLPGEAPGGFAEPGRGGRVRIALDGPASAGAGQGMTLLPGMRARVRVRTAR